MRTRIKPVIRAWILPFFLSRKRNPPMPPRPGQPQPGRNRRFNHARTSVRAVRLSDPVCCAHQSAAQGDSQAGTQTYALRQRRQYDQRCQRKPGTQQQQRGHFIVVLRDRGLIAFIHGSTPFFNLRLNHAPSMTRQRKGELFANFSGMGMRHIVVPRVV